ncbi:MAG TPA: helix-turn-helix domain-containing protein [Candidatus Saccharimonadales bacterium]|nr:helix-turn-helix domain-containing protein [Candidatus Saccharimonadales bacterium]
MAPSIEQDVGRATVQGTQYELPRRPQSDNSAFAPGQRELSVRRMAAPDQPRDDQPPAANQETSSEPVTSHPRYGQRETAALGGAAISHEAVSAKPQAEAAEPVDKEVAQIMPEITEERPHITTEPPTGEAQPAAIEPSAKTADDPADTVRATEKGRPAEADTATVDTERPAPADEVSTEVADRSQPDAEEVPPHPPEDPTEPQSDAEPPDGQEESEPPAEQGSESSDPSGMADKPSSKTWGSGELRRALVTAIDIARARGVDVDRAFRGSHSRLIAPLLADSELKTAADIATRYNQHPETAGKPIGAADVHFEIRHTWDRLMRATPEGVKTRFPQPEHARKAVDPESLAGRLQAHHASSGITQAALAERLDKSPSSIGRYFTGNARPRSQYDIVAMLQAMNVPREEAVVTLARYHQEYRGKSPKVATAIAERHYPPVPESSPATHGKTPAGSPADVIHMIHDAALRARAKDQGE